jgi:hypothetical protein
MGWNLDDRDLGVLNKEALPNEAVQVTGRGCAVVLHFKAPPIDGPAFAAEHAAPAVESFRQQVRDALDAAPAGAEQRRLRGQLDQGRARLAEVRAEIPPCEQRWRAAVLQGDDAEAKKQEQQRGRLAEETARLEGRCGALQDAQAELSQAAADESQAAVNAVAAKWRGDLVAERQRLLSTIAEKVGPDLDALLAVQERLKAVGRERQSLASQAQRPNRLPEPADLAAAGVTS